MFPTTCATTASLSESTRVGDRHSMPTKSSSVGIPSRAIGLLGIMFATLGVSPIGHLGQTLTAAAAKSPQSCPTPCDPRDGSPPGSPVPGILQARTLEWVAISFSNA